MMSGWAMSAWLYMLNTGPTGPVSMRGRPVKSGYQVTVYPNGREDSSSIYDAVLYMPDLALDSDLPSGAWLIGHKCALKATGGNDT